MRSLSSPREKLHRKLVLPQSPVLNGPRRHCQSVLLDLSGHQAALTPAAEKKTNPMQMYTYLNLQE